LNKINCELICTSNSGHLQILYTGFQLLKRQKKINLAYKVVKSEDGKPANAAQLTVKLDASILIRFDTNDFGLIVRDEVDEVDYYFKRSFSEEFIGEELAYKKVFPLGLHYRVQEEFPSLFSIRRRSIDINSSRRRKVFIQQLLGPINNINPKLFRLHSGNCHAKPDFSLEPGIIFIANLWDPERTQKKYYEERVRINEMRTDCVRDRFGG